MASAFKTEVLDLLNEDVSCSDLVDFPLEIYYASGSLINNIPVICGGRFNQDGSWHSSDFCNQFDQIQGASSQN